MIIKTEDIARYRGKVKIPQLGGATIDGFNEITMYKPVGVVLIAQYIDDNKFDRFIVGAFNEAGVIEEKREFIDKTEKDFFDATKYFEELIQKKQPKDDQKPPAVGKFYFCKKTTALYPIVLIEGLPEIIIAEEDIPIVFTPPKTKPFGRLDMTAVSKPEYDVIKSKFALKYNVEESEKFASDKKLSLSDIAIYDMTPYSNSEKNEDGESDEAPDEVNDDKLNANDIEGEDLDDQKQKGKKGDGKKDDKGDKDKGDKEEGEKGDEKDGDEKGDKSDKKEPGEKDDKGDDKGDEKSDDKGGEDGDDKSDAGDGEKSKGDNNGKDGKGRQDKKKNDDNKNVKDTEESQGDFDLSLNQAQKEQIEKNVSSQNLISALQKDYETEDLAAKFRRQNNLLVALDGYTEAELSNLYGTLGIDSKYKKEDFINLVKQKTQTLFK